MTDRPWLFPGATALVGGTLLVPLGAWRRADGPSLRGALPPFLAVAGLLALTQYGGNRLDASGDFLLDPLVTFDSAFHVGLTHELVIGHPPQVPGVAGFPLGYHLGTDLVRAAALRWAGTDPWDSLTRLDVTLWALGLVLALRAVAARLGAPPLAVALVALDASSSRTSRSSLPGTRRPTGGPTSCAGTSCSRSRTRTRSSRPSASSSALSSPCRACRRRTTAGTWPSPPSRPPRCPSSRSFSAPTCCSAWVSRGSWRGGRPRRALLLAALPCAIATAALALGQGGRTVDVVLAPLDLARVTRDTLGLAPVEGAGLLAWAALWLAASLGLRLVAVPEALRSLRGSAAACVLGAIALSGWPLGLLFRVSAPEVLEGQKVVNDAAYLVEQSGPLLWVFAAIALAGFATSPLRRALALGACLLLATPATFQYAAKKATTPPDRLPAAMVRAAHALERVSRPGDVVMQRPGARYPPAPVVLVGRRVPYERFTPYLTQFASRADLEARHELVYRSRFSWLFALRSAVAGLMTKAPSQ